MRPQSAAMKALLDQPGLQIMPGCGDGMGARLIEEAGFATGFVSGSSICAMRLAMPDMDLLTFPEMADAIETVIAAAPGVLWLADGDTGYGNALAVQKTIRAYARRGAAAVLMPRAPTSFSLTRLSRKRRCARRWRRATVTRRSPSPRPPASISCPATRSWSGSASKSSCTRRRSSPPPCTRYARLLSG